MFKKIRVKIILGIIIFAIILITTMNIFNIEIIKKSNLKQDTIAIIYNYIKIVTIGSIVIFLIGVFILVKVLSKYIIYPVDKLIKGGEKITNSKREDMIDMMTSELKD